LIFQRVNIEKLGPTRPPIDTGGKNQEKIYLGEARIKRKDKG